MSEFSNDPEGAAVYGYLRSGRLPAAVGAAEPVLSSVPGRRRRGLANAMEVARAEGLDLGLESMTRGELLYSRGNCRFRPRPTPPGVEALVFGLARTTLGCRRGKAWGLARAWAEAGCAGQAEVLCWVEVVGLRNSHVVRQLRAHGFTPDMLENRIDGVIASRRLRSGERVGSIIGALLALTRQGDMASQCVLPRLTRGASRREPSLPHGSPVAKGA